MHPLRDTGTRRRRVGKLAALDQHHFIADLREHQTRQEPANASTNYDRVCHARSVATRDPGVLSGTTQVVISTPREARQLTDSFPRVVVLAFVHGLVLEPLRRLIATENEQEDARWEK